MWEEKVLLKEIDNYFDNNTKETIMKDLEDAGCLHMIENIEENPYLEGFEVKKISIYNPKFGDDRICECGHTYYRHFDSYENMDAVGCKYCHNCNYFKEKINSLYLSE